MRSWPWADFSTYAWLTTSSPTTPRTWWILALAEAWWRCPRRYHVSVHTLLEFFHLRPPHRWNNIVGQCALSLHRIYCQRDGSLIVTWDGERFFFSSSNLFHKTPQPDLLLGCMHLHNILRLCTWQWDDSLLIWYHPDAEMEQESRYQIPVLLTSPVCIAESFYHRFLLSSEGKPKIFCGSEP